MEARIRFLISLSIVLFILLFKWLSIRIIAAEQTERLCILIFDIPPERFNFRRLFRSLGLDFANASAGLLAIAYVLKDSNLRQLCTQAGRFDLLLAILSFVIFTIFYTIAAKVQYVFLETAERQGNKRWLFGLVGFINGLFMLFNSSWLVVGAK